MLRKTTTSHANKGFTIIEVLVSLIILTSVIATLNAAFKIYQSRFLSMERYENGYTNTLSIKDKLAAEDLGQRPEGTGEINGSEYSYSATLVDSRRTFYMDTDSGAVGNVGPVNAYLYKVEVSVNGVDSEFYKMQTDNNTGGVRYE